MQIILLGAPGSGKGTQAEMIASHRDAPHVSTGDILRAAVREGTELGEKAKPIMERGDLVPDDLMIGIIRERLVEDDVVNGFVLDGFPRTIEQAERLDVILEGNDRGPLKVLLLSVPDEVIVRRLGGRRSCPDCGAIYHVESSPPEKEGICDRCGGSLRRRSDDTEEAIQKRLDAFREQTVPVVEHYRAKRVLNEIDGVGSVDEIFERIENILTQ